MTTEDKSQMPLYSPEDENEAQKAPDNHSTNGTLKATNKWTGFQGKTMWDWLQLLGVLAIPLVVAGATLLFGLQQANLANQQHENDQKIANQQHVADQKQALDQQRADTLQKYIDNIQDLLLNHNLLKASPTNPDNLYYDVATLARARTLTALQGLDPDRKALVVQFIYEAQLIGFLDAKKNPHDKIIDLGGANLSYANLNYYAYLPGAFFQLANLSYADLSHADLFDANLNFANLSFANLRDSYLANADLSNADLSHADLSGANLNGADLRYVDFSGARNLTQQQLNDSILCGGAILPTGLLCED